MNTSKVKKLILKQFGFNVRNLREEKNLSQEKLAEKCNLHRTYVSDIERGKRNVSIINIYKIAKALNVKADRIFKNILA